MQQTKAEFVAGRRVGIGGTDWQHILNMPPYGCARKLMYEKLGVAVDYPEAEHGYFERGRVLEPIVADMAAEFFNVTLRKPGKLPKGNAPSWWMGNPDRLVVPDGIWEGKTMHPIRFAKAKREGVPPEHTMQVQHYTKQTGRDYGLYSILEPVSWDLYHAHIPRDDELLDLMEEQGAKFWEQKEATKLPPALKAGDSRCRKCSFRWTCQGEALFMAVPEMDPLDLPVVDNAELNDLVTERDELTVVMDQAKALRESCNQQIKDILENQGKYTTPLGRNIYWTSSSRNTIDSKKLRVEEPLIAEKYTKKTLVTSLRVY